jgi:hypothetical protein
MLEAPLAIPKGLPGVLQLLAKAGFGGILGSDCLPILHQVLATLRIGALVRHQRSLDRTGGLNKGEFLAHRNVHRSEDETANPTIEGTG